MSLSSLSSNSTSASKTSKISNSSFNSIENINRSPVPQFKLGPQKEIQNEIPIDTFLSSNFCFFCKVNCKKPNHKNCGLAINNVKVGFKLFFENISDSTYGLNENTIIDYLLKEKLITSKDQSKHEMYFKNMFRKFWGIFFLSMKKYLNDPKDG